MSDIPLTGTAYDAIRIEVPCPKCGEVSLKPLRELDVSDHTLCSYCEARIDTSTKEWRSRIKKAVDGFTRIGDPRKKVR